MGNICNHLKQNNMTLIIKMARELNGYYNKDLGTFLTMNLFNVKKYEGS